MHACMHACMYDLLDKYFTQCASTTIQCWSSIPKFYSDHVITATDQVNPKGSLGHSRFRVADLVWLNPCGHHFGQLPPQ